MLEKRKRIFNEKHLFIILAMNNLVNTFEDQDQLKKATTIKKKILKKRKRIFGKEHLNIILAINNLVKTLRNQS